MRNLSALMLVFLLCACGGGGGGGGSTSPVYRSSTSTGLSVSVAYTGANLGTPTSISSGATYTETVDANNIIQAASFVAANGNSASFNKANGDSIVTVAPGVNGFSNATQSALTAWAPYFGWSYQSFGVWANGNTVGQISAGSAGTSTLGASIPTSGTAVYSGIAAGIFGNATASYFVTSNMTASTNFGTRSIAFSTTNSAASTTVNGTYVSTGGLNLSGNLTYAPGVNSFSGTVNSSGATVMTGTAGGQFYGPSAQEIGGVFAVKNGNIGYIGGFGGKR
jgi:hypothetical protein